MKTNMYITMNNNLRVACRALMMMVAMSVLALTTVHAQIFTHPVNTNVLEGSSAFFTVEITAGTAVYQWEMLSGSTWIPVPADALHIVWDTPGPSTHTTILELVSVPKSWDGRKYRCNITDPPPISNEATLTVLPKIATNPVSVTINENDNTSFTVIMNSLSTLSYRWDYNDGSGTGWQPVTIPDIYHTETVLYSSPYSPIMTTTTTLELTGVPIWFDGYQYRCVYGPGGAGQEISGIATLKVVSVSPPFIINDGLRDGTVAIEYSEQLRALGYQPVTWAIATTPGSGKLPPGLSLNSNTGVISGIPTMYGLFPIDVIARNKYGDVTVGYSILIHPNPRIISHPVDRTVASGSNTSFSVVVDGCTDKPWYAWQYRTDENPVWNYVGDFGVYSGAGAATMSLTGVPLDYDGYEYRCLVHCTGKTMYSNSAKLTVVGTPPRITTTSLPPGVVGVPYNVTLTATGDKPIVWDIIAGSLTGSLPQNSITDNSSFGLSQYSISENPSDGLSQFSINENPSDGISVSIFSGNAPTGLSLNSVTGAITGTPLYNGQLSFTVRASNGIKPDDTRQFGLLVNEPPPVEVITVTSPPRSFCTVEQFVSIPFTQTDNVNLMKYNITFSDEAKAAGFADQLTFDNLPADMMFKIDIPSDAPTKTYNATVNILCDEIDNLQDKYPFTFSVINNGVTIKNQPPSYQSLCNGVTLALVVDVEGSPNSYQWYNNGVAISNATGKDFVANQAGSYYVEIMGECGVIRSTPAVVAPPPAEAAGVGLRVKWGNVLYVESAVDKYVSYQWYHNGSAIQGATYVYYSDKEGFLGEYVVRCFKQDGSFDETCPVVFGTRTTSASTLVYPSMIKANDRLHIDISDAVPGAEAIVEIYSLIGTKVFATKIQTPVATIQPAGLKKGNYIIKLMLSSGEIFNSKLIVQ